MNLIQIRKAKKLTQAELAKKLGVNQTLISKYEKNKVKPSLDNAQKLASVLDVDIQTILACFYGEPKKEEV